MKMRSQLFFVALLALLVAAGCGGGGGAGGAGGGGGAGKVSVFATDAPNPDFDHVWVTIYSVDLVPSGGGANVNVFSSDTGKVVDVRALRDSTGGRFEFLDANGVPAGTYTGAVVVLDKSVGVVKHGDSSTSNDHFDDSANAAGSTTKSQFTFNFPQPFVATGSNPVVLDFALANWSVDSTGKVHAVVKSGDGSGLGDENRHEHSEFEGTVTGLAGSAGAQTFNLVGEHNHQLAVTTDANTVISNSDGSDNPVLANAERVHVSGKVVNGNFVAGTIVIQVAGQHEDRDSAEGTFSNVSTSNDTFTLNVQHAEEFVPAQPNLNVVVTSTTKYFSDGGVSMDATAFFTAMSTAPAGSRVHVEGSVSGSTFTASSVRLLKSLSGGDDSGGDTSHLVAAGGSVSNAGASGGTFTLTVSQWQGAQLQNGATLNITTDANTVFRNQDNNVSAADWFAALTSNSHVVVFGTLNNGTLAASKVLITIPHQINGD